jgi:hypothetical protein
MKHALPLTAALALLGCSAAPESSPDPQRAAEPGVDDRADRILRDVGAHLGGSPQLSFHADIGYEVVEPVGDGVEASLHYGGRTTFTLTRPGALRVSYEGDDERREFYVDGESATLLAPDENVYASIDSVGTIEGALDAFWDRMGVAPPLADFAYDDPYARLAPGIVTAAYLGQTELDGVRCHHIFIVQEEMDWQVWIEADGDPLPRRMEIVYRSLPRTPRFEAEFGGWDLESSPSPDVFRFEPPAGAVQVPALVSLPLASAEAEDR